jgi:hypothetical protein
MAFAMSCCSIRCSRDDCIQPRSGRFEASILQTFPDQLLTGSFYITQKIDFDGYAPS